MLLLVAGRTGGPRRAAVASLDEAAGGGVSGRGGLPRPRGRTGFRTLHGIDRLCSPRCSNARMSDEELMQRVRALRSRGTSPKHRALGIRPARVAPLVRDIAREETAAAAVDGSCVTERSVPRAGGRPRWR